MKNFLKSVFHLLPITILSICLLSGCAPGYYQPDTWQLGYDFVESFEDAIKNNDYESFKDLYTESDETAIQEQFTTAVQNASLLDYQNREIIEVLEDEDYYVMSFVYYTTSGVHPNTHIDTNAFAYAFKIVDNEFKIVLSQDVITKLSNKILESDYVPEEFRDAHVNGRNATLFSPGNFIDESDTPVYEGVLFSSVRFAWQNENGDVEIGILLQNGTDQNIHYTTGTLSLTDDTLGTIISTNITLDKTVIAGECEFIYYTIPAQEVYTGMQTWTSVHGHVDASYQ